MPHLYFDVVADGTTTKDQTGLEISDHDLERQVRTAAAEIAREQALAGKNASVSIEVNDESGHTVMVVEADAKAFRIAPSLPKSEAPE